MRRFPHLLATFALALACVPADEPGDEFRVLLGSPVSAEVGKLNLEWNGSSYRYPAAWRVAGAWVSPLDRVVVAALEDDGSTSRVQTNLVDPDPDGELGQSDFVGYPHHGSAATVGMAAASYRDGEGNVDAVFAFADPATDEIYAFDVQGEGTGVPGVAKPVLDRPGPNELIDPVIPALESGTVEDESRIMLAYVAKYPAAWIVPQLIVVGFLQRDDATGEWVMDTREMMLASDPSGCGDVYRNVAAAFDPEHEEWSLAWICDADKSAPGGGWNVYMQRFDWEGSRLAPEAFRLSGDPSDGLHSGTMLSYNRRSGHWLVQYQHNLRLVENDGDAFTCLDLWGNPIDYLSCSNGTIADRGPERFVTGGRFATVVDYREGRSFRIGGACKDDMCVGAPKLGGHVMHLADPLTLAGRKGWFPEGGHPFAWDTPPSGQSVEMHTMVRVPTMGTNALLHVQEDPGFVQGTVRVSFADEEPSFAFDE